MRILFVCMGNICRSPTAEGVMRRLLEDAGLADRVEVESAGTGGWHAGEPPDERATVAARRRGVTLEGAARQVRADDFERFDLLIALDRSNLRELLMRAPVIPNGWPSAIAPPNGLSFSGSRPSSSRHGTTWAANASLSSTMSMSSIVIPAWVSTFLTAGIGPRPMISGRIAATEEATIRAFGSTPSAFALSSDMTSTAAAPSLSGQELPAVTVPFSGSNAGLSSASFSIVVPGRGPSSRVASPTGTISASK